MKYYLLILIFLFGGLTGFSQIIEEEEVPKDVVEAFKRRNRRVSEYTWIKNKDNYQVKYEARNQKITNEYDAKGELLMSKTEVDERRLIPAIERHISENYGNLRRESAFLVTKGRDKYYSINLYERGNKKRKTELQYTTAGQFITAWLPEIIIEEKEEVVDEFHEAVKEDRLTIRKAEMGGQKIPTRELPSAAQTYLSENYNRDWTTRECIIVDTDDGLQYYVIMRRRGGQRESWEHYFNIHGELVSKDRVD